MQKNEEKQTISLTFVNQYLGYEETNWVTKTKQKDHGFSLPNLKHHSLHLDNLDQKQGKEQSESKDNKESDSWPPGQAWEMVETSADMGEEQKEDLIPPSIRESPMRRAPFFFQPFSFRILYTQHSHPHSWCSNIACKPVKEPCALTSTMDRAGTA